MAFINERSLIALVQNVSIVQAVPAPTFLRRVSGHAFHPAVEEDEERKKAITN
jgi:hypothetical protein